MKTIVLGPQAPVKYTLLNEVDKYLKQAIQIRGYFKKMRKLR